MAVLRGRPIFLGGNDDYVLKYLDKVDTSNPPNRTAATGLTGLTALISATPTGSAINATLSKSVSELSTTAYYAATFEGSDIVTHLTAYAGIDVYEIFGDASNINIVTARRVMAVRGS